MINDNLILYSTDDGLAHFVLHKMGGNIWLSQAGMADLYQVTPQAITQHIKAVYDECELSAEATCKESLQVQKEGNRLIKRSIKQYSLPVILAVGYRVNSPRGTQFRQWATRTLDEYMIKGFAMDDERLKDPKWNYFDELLVEFAELRAKQRQHLCLDDWRRYVDSFMEFNEQPLLNNAGKVSHEQMREIASQRYEEFDGNRKANEAVLEDAQELVAIEQAEKKLKSIREIS